MLHTLYCSDHAAWETLLSSLFSPLISIFISMNIEELRNYCLSKTGTEETLPFGPDTLVFKVAGKMYAAMGLEWEETAINLKCDPERAEQLRDAHEDIIPGYHMNKKHWNTVYTDRGLDDDLVMELIDHSYELIVSKLPKKVRESIRNA